MKSVLSIFLIVALLLLSLTVGYSMADEIYLKNGDRISGKVINMKENKLFINTSYSGKIGIAWSEIINLKTDQEIAVLLNDDTLVNGNTHDAKQGKMNLDMGEFVDSVSFSLSSVKAINPEPAGKVKIKARVNAGLTFKSGNTEKETTHFDGEFIARTDKNRYTIGVETNSAKDSGEKTESNTLGYLKYDHFISKKWFVYSNALFEKDKFKDLSLRSLIGIGSGYQFFETSLTNLSLEAGINYVNEDYITALDESYSSGRWAINYDRYFYNKAFQFFHFHEGFVSIEDTDDIFIKSRTGIRIPLFAAINATLQYNIDWEKSPAPGRTKTDRELMFTLGYQFEQ